MSEEIITSWKKNAEEWIKVIQDNSIPSRKLYLMPFRNCMAKK